MPRALAIETSGRAGSIALVDGSTVIAEQTVEAGLKHAAGVLPMIDQLFREQRWKPSDLEQVYISAGPGSFTGLRIGITIAKTIAFAGAAKLVAVPTTRVLVENAPPEAQHVIIVLDAKREQIFTARFEKQDAVWAERESAHLDRLSSILERSPHPVHLLGEGIPYHRQFVPADSDVIVTDESTWRARASVVAKIGMEMAARGEFTNPDQVIPIYVRKPEAEEKWENRGMPF